MKSALLTAWSVALAGALWVAPLEPASADEGMWLFSNLPRQELKQKYGAELADAWLEQLRKSCVHIGRGGSGAFVSADGLLVTNHHVALRWLSHLPGQSSTWLQVGFYAGDRESEIKCPGLEVSVPWESEDVTARVHDAIKPGMSLAAARRARLAVIGAIEKESQEKTGLASEVEALFEGARYRVIRHRTYADVRLVFAPEYVAGRIFDCCFLRAYEDGRPAKITHYLHLADREPSLGDLVFIAGFPGQTDRFLESAHLDVLYGKPHLQKLKWLGRTEYALNRFAKQSVANAWEAFTELEFVKAWATGMWYLVGPALEAALASKRAEEVAFRGALAKEPEQLRRYQEAEKQLAQLLKDLDALAPEYFFLESGRAFNSYLFSYARGVVRLAEETAKPEAERLREYTGARAKEGIRQLLAPRAIGNNLEQVKLAESLSMYAAWAGDNDELAVRVLGGKTPEERARQLIRESALDDAAMRAKLVEGGKKAVDASTDPMIQLARLVDRPARAARLAYEEKVHEPSRQAYAAMAAIRTAVKGGETYPDGTGSLRLAFGRVRQHDAYTAQVGTIKDIFNLNAGNRGGEVPARWVAAQNRLDPGTRLWLSSSADVAPGNSGSPVVDGTGRLVAIAARSNSSTDAVAYQEGTSGNEAVSISGMLALLENAYGAGNLVKELGGPTPKEVARNDPPPPPAGIPEQRGLPAAPSIDARYMEAYRAHLEAVDKRNKSLLPALINALKDSDKEVVDAVAVALGNIGKGAIPALVQLLQSPDPKLRAHAATALGKMGPAGEEALRALVKAMQDEYAPVRRESARAIALIVQGTQPVFPAFDAPTAYSPGGSATSKTAPTISAESDSKIELKKGERIIFLGDSITAAGVGPKGYVTLVKNALADKHKDLGIEVIGAGVSGNKVPDLQKRLDKAVLQRKPTLVVIYIGINDVWHGEKDPAKGTAPEKFEAGLKDIIGQIHNADARVILCTPSVIGEFPGGANTLDEKLDAYADISRRVAKDTGSTLCDLRKAFALYLAANNTEKREKGILTSDRVHLNEAGNRFVAETILKALGD